MDSPKQYTFSQWKLDSVQLISVQDVCNLELIIYLIPDLLKGI